MNIISENQFNVLQDIISKTDAKFNERLEQINNTNSMKEIAEICRLQIDGELLNYIKSNFKDNIQYFIFICKINRKLYGCQIRAYIQ